MKKIKQLWNENRILFVLFIILIVCFIAICFVVMSYFVGTNKSVYGDRLKNKVKVSKTAEDEYVKDIEMDEMVDEATIRVGVRTIYITLKFNDKASLVEAESKAVASLEALSEDILSYYDINFILLQDTVAGDETKGFTLMGSSNVNGTGVVWSNNTEIIEEEENEE